MTETAWRMAKARPRFIEWREPIPNDVHEVHDHLFPVEKVMTPSGEQYAYPEFDVIYRKGRAIGVMAKEKFIRDYEVIE